MAVLDFDLKKGPTQEQLKALALAQWKENNPKLYAALQAANLLETQAEGAARWTLQAMQQMQERGMTLHESWMEAMELWIFLPAEDEQRWLAEDEGAMPTPSRPSAYPQETVGPPLPPSPSLPV
jgi:hypothetical protein